MPKNCTIHRYDFLFIEKYLQWLPVLQIEMQAELDSKTKTSFLRLTTNFVVSTWSFSLRMHFFKTILSVFIYLLICKTYFKDILNDNFKKEKKKKKVFNKTRKVLFADSMESDIVFKDSAIKYVYQRL